MDFLTVKGRKKRYVSSFPNQYIIEEKLNGVMCNGKFYPYKFIRKTDLSAKSGIRYFIKTIVISVVKTGIDVLNSLYVEITVNGYNNAVAYSYVPAMTLATDFVAVLDSFPVGLLCDENTGSHMSSDHWGFDYQIIIIYAEIDVLPGQLKPKVIVE